MQFSCLFLLQFLWNAECCVAFEDDGNEQGEFPFIAPDRAEVILLHQHQSTGRDEQGGTEELLVTQAAHDKPTVSVGNIVFADALCKLQTAEEQGPKGEDQSGVRSYPWQHGHNGTGNEQEATRLKEKVLKGGELLHIYYI